MATGHEVPMGVEIERKFLVVDGWLPEGEGRRCVQGYLTSGGASSVRIRVIGDEAFLTIKSGMGLRRLEFEYPVPVADAEELLQLCQGRVVEKVRFVVAHGDHQWEVDLFSGANAGLVTAEVELRDEQEMFERPAWLGDEVTGEARYVNAVLAQRPYSTWGQS